MRAVTFAAAAACGLLAFTPLSLACGDEGGHASNYPSNGETCPAVSDVKTMPFRDDWGVDAAYDRFRTGSDCDQVLIDALASVKLMTDPRCPSYGGFVEADAAFFVLVEKFGLHFEDVLPKGANWKEQGIYAYFEYVEEPRRRAKLNERLLTLIDKAKKRNDAATAKIG